MAEDSFRQYRNPSQVETDGSDSDSDSDNGDFFDIDLTLANPNVPRDRLESTRIDPSANIEGEQQQVPVEQNPPPPPPTGRQSNVSVNVEPLIEVLNPVQPPRTRSSGPVQVISYGGYIPPPPIGDERPKRVKKSAQQLFD